MKKLPDALLEAWSADTMQALGGWMELAGIDPTKVLGVKSIKDHPWVGLSISFIFPEMGVGKIIRCLTHPHGKLMFDVEFDDPVPHILGYTGHYRIYDSRTGNASLHRYYGYELQEIAFLKEQEDA